MFLVAIAVGSLFTSLMVNYLKSIKIKKEQQDYRSYRMTRKKIWANYLIIPITLGEVIGGNLELLISEPIK